MFQSIDSYYLGYKYDLTFIFLIIQIKNILIIYKPQTSTSSEFFELISIT